MQQLYFHQVVRFRPGNPATVTCALANVANPKAGAARAEVKIYF